MQYLPQGDAVSNLEVYNCRIVDSDGIGGKEAVEAMLSGVHIHNYFEDKGFGVAVWGVQNPLKNYLIHHNVFAKIRRTTNIGFGQSAAVFVPDVATNFKIYNNVFDRLGNTLSLQKARDVDIGNNVFLNTLQLDVELGRNVTFKNNLKFNRDPSKNKWVLVGDAVVDSSNVLGDPGFRATGERITNFYLPAGPNSLVVDKGSNVGLTFTGSAPDIGAFELPNPK